MVIGNRIEQYVEWEFKNMERYSNYSALSGKTNRLQKLFTELQSPSNQDSWNS